MLNVSQLSACPGWPIQYEAEGAALGAQWARGLLLHGPPGCGKTALVEDVADELGIAVHHLSAADVYGAYTGHSLDSVSISFFSLPDGCVLRRWRERAAGESERHLREAFDRAQANVAAGKPTVVFIDELDALAPKRDSSRPHESRVVAQLLTLLDGAASDPGDGTTYSSRQILHQGVDMSGRPAAHAGTRGRLTFIGATNNPNAIDPALRRLGRLDREVAVGLPNTQVGLPSTLHMVAALGARHLWPEHVRHACAHRSARRSWSCTLARCPWALTWTCRRSLRAATATRALTWRRCAGRRRCMRSWQTSIWMAPPSSHQAAVLSPLVMMLPIRVTVRPLLPSVQMVL